MSLSLEDLKGELRENQMRVEEVLSGMDSLIVRLESKVRHQDERINTLEAQVASLGAALCNPSEDLG